MSVCLDERRESVLAMLPSRERLPMPDRADKAGEAGSLRSGISNVVEMGARQ